MNGPTDAVRTRVVRSLAVGAAAVLALAGLTSCSGGSSGDDDGHFTLTIPTSQAPWNPAYSELISAYEEETGNKIVLRAFPNPDVKTQEINDIRSQKHTFDVFQINEQDLVQFNENKWIQPFTDIDPGFEPDENIYSYSNIGRWDADKQNFDSSGEFTNLPILGNVVLFMYRKDIYEELGLEVPTTWDQAIANGEAIQDSGEVKYGGVYLTKGIPGNDAATFYFQALMNSAGGAWFADPGTNWTPTADRDAGVQAATWFRQLAEQGPKATTTIGQGEAIAAMQAGEAAQTILVGAAAAQLEDADKSAVAGKIGYAQLPKSPEGDSSSPTGLWSLAVPADLPKDRAQHALEFIEWVTSEKAQVLFAKNGGIPVRPEAYEASGLPDSTKAALAEVNKTAANLPAKFTALRYSFSTDMLNFTEPELASIAAGKVTPQEGMQAINDQLTSLITKEDLPMN